MKLESKQTKKDVIVAKEKLILENFHRVSKQLGMLTEKAEPTKDDMTDLVPVEPEVDSTEDKTPTDANPIGKNPVGKDADSSVKSPTSSEVTSPTRTSTEVTSPTRTSTEVRSPTRTATSTDAYTSGNITVTGGAGDGATTTVTIMPAEKAPMDKSNSASGAEYTKKDAEPNESEKKKVKITKEQYYRVLMQEKIV